MKRISTIIYLVCCVGLSATAFAQATGDYRTNQSGDWNVTSTWERWNGATWVTPAPSAPVSTDGVITIRSPHTVTVTANVTVDQVVVNSGGQITVNTGITFTVNNGTGTDLAVTGTVSVIGSLAMGQSSSTLVVNSGGSVSIDGSLTISSTAPSFTINSGGAVTVAGSLSLSGGNPTLTVSGTLTTTGSASVSLASISDLTVSGTITMSGSSTISVTRGNGGDVMTVNSGGLVTMSGTASISNGGTGTALVDFLNGSTLRMGSANIVNGTGSFTLASGASIEIGSTAGIVSSTASATGNIQTTGGSGRNFNVGSNYTYNGTANQNMGTGFPTNLTGILTINNPGFTVTLDNARTIANGGSINLTAGTFAASTNLTMATTSSISRSGGNMTGTPQGAGTYNVTYTGNSKTTGTELAGSGLNNLTLNMTAGQTLTLDQSPALPAAGTLTLTSGTLNANGNTVTINNTAPGAVVIPDVNGSITGRIDRVTLLNSTGTYKFTNTNTLIVPAASQPSITMSVTSFPSTYPPFAPAGTSVNRYYVLSPSAAFTASEVRLEYLESENINSIPELSLVLFRRNAATSAWVNEGGVPVPASNYVTLGGAISTWSDWAVGDGNNPLPIQLSSFTGTLINNRVKLDWTTASEVNNYGFYVQKRYLGLLDWSTVENSFVAGHGTTNTPQHYTFTDNSAFTGTTEYRLKQVDLDGSIHFTDPIQVESPTSVRELAPIEFALKQNYPNPFNPETNIKFSVETAGRATLQLYNMLGQKVATLFDGEVEAGFYQTVRLNGSNLASGMYLYRLQSGQKSELKKLMLIK